MKALILSFLMTLAIIPNAHAIDQASIEALKKQGFEVRMGELTGAGSKLSMGRLAGFIHPRGIVMKNDCKNIQDKDTRPLEPTISDITKVIVDQSVLSANEFEGFFTYQQ